MLESKGTFFILIIVVAILTIAIAAMVGYLFLVQGTSHNNTDSGNIKATTKEVTYKESDLATKALFEEKKYFNLKHPQGSKIISILQCNVYVKYVVTVDKKLTEEKFKLYQPEMRQLVIKYFMGVSLEDANKIETFDIADKALTKQMNNLLNEGNEKDPKTYIIKVVFDDWVAQ